MALEIGFIGAGTVGTALALALSGKGHKVVAVASRSKESAEKLARQIPGCKALSSGQEMANSAQLVFITTPDDPIRHVAAQVQWKPGQWVVHCSGTESREVLDHASALGAITGVFHPLQSLAAPNDSSDRFKGITFALEGEGDLLEALKGFAKDLGGNFILLLPGDKVLYHASAVLVSNYLVTLIGMASELWEQFGETRDKATQALLPLVRGTLDNVEKVGLPNCLTGPVSRGDEITITKHLQTLKQIDEGLWRAYSELGLQTIPIALAKGRIREAQAKRLEALFNSTIKEKVESHP